MANARSIEPGRVLDARVRVPQLESMPLERLDARLDEVWRHRLTLVVAPAGSGKSTVLGRVAARTAVPVAWYRAEALDTRVESLVQHLGHAFRRAAPSIAGDWRSVEDAVRSLEEPPVERTLLIIDDLHALEGTPAEAALERLIDYMPPAVHVLAAARTPPRFNLPRLRVSGDLLEVTGDDLRFRSWEVERLFRDHYHEPLGPEDLAQLARRTEGWAAGLQLFHLATRGRPPDERRRVLAAMGSGSRLMRDYLTRNVIEQLSGDLRDFLVDTCVLGRLDPALCNALRGRRDSAALLDELERRHLFTQRLSDGAYRYHEVLRSHLQEMLLEAEGEVETAARYRDAGRLLEQAGATAEALEAYSRAEDWETARRLLDEQGPEVAGASAPPEFGALRSPLVQRDPWLLLARARRVRAEGRLEEAVHAYSLAEVAFGARDAASVCRSERLLLAPWLEQRPSPRADASGLLRSAVVRNPLRARRDAARLSHPEGPLVEGLALLVAGRASDARAVLLRAAAAPEAAGVLATAASLAAGIAGLLAADTHASVEVEGAVDAAERARIDWLARLGRASLAVTGRPQAIEEAAAVAGACRSVGDTWGAAVAGLFRAIGTVSARQSRREEMESCAASLDALGAPVLETWALGLLAVTLARVGAPDARAAALQAERLARSRGVDAARLLSYLALARADPADAATFDALAEAMRNDAGLWIEIDAGEAPVSGTHGPEGATLAPALAALPDEASDPAGGVRRTSGGDAHHPPVTIRCLGGFSMALAGRPIDLSAVRPRARALLRLLALHAGTPVHQDQLKEAFWPDADPDVGSRSLHVAVAAVRRALEPSSTRGGFELLVRHGESYELVLPPGSSLDVRDLEEQVGAGRAARDRGDLAMAERAFAAALEIYRGDLLPEDGPAEWVTSARDWVCALAVEAARAVAEMRLVAGNPDAAARSASAGLGVDRYQDALWRLLIEARARAGDQGAAQQARRGYEQMLAELGVEHTVS